jgi:hypothetical protein
VILYNGSGIPNPANGSVVNANMQYGSMWADEVNQLITVGAVNIYYQIPGSITDGLGSVAFTFQNARELKCNAAGIYVVHYSLTLEVTAANQDLSACVMVNAAVQSNTTNHATAGSGPVKNCNPSGAGIITLAVNDLVRLAAANHTAVNSIRMRHANLTIWRIA